nr:hypothetical protein [Sodalis glossinidius]
MLTPRLQKLGWWRKQVVVDSQGNAEAVQLGSARRLATIYNVNTRPTGLTAVAGYAPCQNAD